MLFRLFKYYIGYYLPTVYYLNIYSQQVLQTTQKIISTIFPFHAVKKFLIWSKSWSQLFGMLKLKQVLDLTSTFLGGISSPQNIIQYLIQKSIINIFLIIIMSHYRQSPSKSPYKSIVKSILDQRIVEDEIALKRGIAIEAEQRRLLDQVSILRLKLRKTDEVEIKYEALVKQVTLLNAENQSLIAEINDRKIEADKLKLALVHTQDKDNHKSAQLSEHIMGLKLENEELIRDKIESRKVFEGHVRSLEVQLEGKIRELQSLGFKFNKTLSEKQTNQIRFEEQKARLRNQMDRTEHLRQRQAAEQKQKRFAQKIIEIEGMKRNHLSQIVLLQDEVKKLTRLSELKSAELDGQIVQNRQLKAAQESQMRDLLEQNQALRIRIAKLEEHNRSEIENIQTKYSNMQAQGTINLKQQHGNQIRLLLSELDKQKWLLGQKNLQIQQLTHEKRELKQASEDYQIQLTNQINLLKSKLLAQGDKYTEDKHHQASKINGLEERILRETQNYHERVKHFTHKIEQLQGDIRKKQVEYDKVRKETDLERENLLKEKFNLRQELATIKLNLNDRSNQLEEEKSRAQEYRKKTQQEYQKLAREISQLQQSNESLRDDLEALRENQNNEKILLKQQNQSLRRTNQKLEQQLNSGHSKSTRELGDLSEAHRSQIKRIEGILNLKLEEVTRSFREQKSDLQGRLALAQKYAKDKEQQLRNLLQKFEQLNFYFNNSQKLVQFVPKSDASILQAFNEQRHQSQFRVFDK